MRADSAIQLVCVYPELLGTYGDIGNVLALQHRARRHGFATQLHEVDARHRVPRFGDVYFLGGGEDRAQVVAARRLRADHGLRNAVDGGAVVLAVCAGFQLLGARFPGEDGAAEPGLGLLDATTTRLSTRAVGEVLTAPRLAGVARLTGFENHAGATSLGPWTAPLGDVETGVGNGDGTEGAVAGRVVCTYLHGPVLARNPSLADLLLGWVVGSALAPLAEREVEQLRDERIASSSSAVRHLTSGRGR